MSEICTCITLYEKIGYCYLHIWAAFMIHHEYIKNWVNSDQVTGARHSLHRWCGESLLCLLEMLSKRMALGSFSLTAPSPPTGSEETEMNSDCTLHAPGSNSFLNIANLLPLIWQPQSPQTFFILRFYFLALILELHCHLRFLIGGRCHCHLFCCRENHSPS